MTARTRLAYRLEGARECRDCRGADLSEVTKGHIRSQRAKIDFIQPSDYFQFGIVC